MKITKQYLKQIIKEEIQRIHESNQTPDISMFPQEMSLNNKKFVIKSTSELEQMFAKTKQKSDYSGTNFIEDVKEAGLGRKLLQIVQIIRGEMGPEYIYSKFIESNEQIYPTIDQYLSKNPL